MAVAQFEVIEQTKDPDAATGQIALLDADGNPWTPSGGNTPASVAWDAITGKPATIPVTKAAVTASVKAADATAAAGETVTKAEFDAVVSLANETKRQFNAMIMAQRAAGLADER